MLVGFNITHIFRTFVGITFCNSAIITTIARNHKIIIFSFRIAK